MKAIDSIKRAVDYIEEHMGEEIKIADLANHCYLSPFYFQRLFHDTTGYSIEKYIQYRRLACATIGLQEGKPVGQVAIDHGFKSPEHFSRAFKSIYKMTPSAYSKEIAPLYHVYKPDVILRHAKLNLGDRYISNNLVLEIQVHQKEEIKLIGYDLFCPFGIDTPGVDHPGIAWETFHKIKEKIPNRCEPRREFGISHEHGEKGFQYLASSVVHNIQEIPDDMISFTLPAGTYACCIYENEKFDEAVSTNMKNAMDYFHQWFMENKLEVASQYVIESYTDQSFEAPYRIEIWAHIKDS